jgi:N-acyl amino acid synthase of PEP-CTERM/exosortase system
MYLPQFLNLGTGFRKYFETLPALDDDLRNAAYRIRHSVYCEELGYEPSRPDELETDEFDRHSVHCLLRGAASREMIGCVRLVLADPEDPAAPFPFERLCAATVDRSIVDIGRIDRAKTAEVSRLAVVAHYRRRKGERAVSIGLDEGDFGTPDRPRFPYIAAGLYLGMIAQAHHHGIETLFMLTERRLARQLTRLGVKLTQIGPAIEHRGLRYPSMMSTQEVIDGLNFFVRPLFATIAAEMETAYQKAATSD